MCWDPSGIRGGTVGLLPPTCVLRPPDHGGLRRGLLRHPFQGVAGVVDGNYQVITLFSPWL